MSLDGTRLGILTYGDVATVPIPPGHHRVVVHNTLSRKAAEFDAAPGEHVRFTTANVPGKGYAYWGLFVGAALMWTILERDADDPSPSPPPPRPFRY